LINDRHTQLENALRPVVEAMQFEFWGMELVQSRGHSTLRVFIELELRHIVVDDCASVSRRLSDVLDEIDLISEDYHLEVSSPGMDCPLFYPSQYQRMVGSELQLSTHLPIEGRKRYRAFLTAANSEQIEISFEKKTLSLRYAEIAKAHVIPDYRKPAPVRPLDPKPGSDDASAD
jgi:ribosome maturation factor RimP